MAVNVIVGPRNARGVTLGNPQKNVNIGTPGVTFTPLDYRQGIVDLPSGASNISFTFSTPFVSDPVFGGGVVFNDNTYDDGYGYLVYNLSKTGCNVCLSDEIHTDGYKFHYYATAT